MRTNLSKLARFKGFLFTLVRIKIEINNMETNFFQNAKLNEQRKRHLNLVFNACYLNHIENPEHLNIIARLRESDGYMKVFEEIFYYVLPQLSRDYLIYIKNRYNIDDDTFEEIIGIKEIYPEIKSPGGYNQEEDFILVFHLLLVITSLYRPTKKQIDFIVGIAKSFNYSINQIQFIVNTLVPLMQRTTSYDDIVSVEQKLQEEFINEYNNLPPISHG